MHRSILTTLVATSLSFTPSGPAAAPPDGETVAPMMARVEGRQVPDRQGFDGQGYLELDQEPVAATVQILVKEWWGFRQERQAAAARVAGAMIPGEGPA